MIYSNLKNYLINQITGVTMKSNIEPMVL